MQKDTKRFEAEFLKKAVLSYPPRHVTIGITSSCNNRCVFCAYHSDDAKESSNVYGLHYNLCLSDFKKMVDMCYSSRVPHVHICGTGEPFFNNEVLKMMDYCIAIYGKTSIQTNFHRPLFEKKNYLDEIRKRAKGIEYITTDILSGDPQQHNELKKGSNYEDVLNAMEYINQSTPLRFRAHLILTHENYNNINRLIDDIYERGINASLEIVNLHPHNFNRTTSHDAPYKRRDIEITKVLESAIKNANKKGVQISVPRPFDSQNNSCGSFWTRFQTWPTKGNDPSRYHENVIIGGCNAVVRGKLSTLGYIFDYKDIMSLWNNKYFTFYRKELLKGRYPDTECMNCQNGRMWNTSEKMP